MGSLREAWQLARNNVEKAQKRQKQQHDRKAKDVDFSVEDRVALEEGWYIGTVIIDSSDPVRSFKWSCKFVSFGCLYCWHIRVALDRLRHCSAQITSLEGQMRRKRGRPLGKKKKDSLRTV